MAARNMLCEVSNYINQTRGLTSRKAFKYKSIIISDKTGIIAILTAVQDTKRDDAYLELNKLISAMSNGPHADKHLMLYIMSGGKVFNAAHHGTPRGDWAHDILFWVKMLTEYGRDTSTPMQVEKPGWNDASHTLPTSSTSSASPTSSGVIKKPSKLFIVCNQPVSVKA